MSSTAPTPMRRRNLCALALPAIPLALLAGTLLSPTDSTDNVPQLRAASVHGDRWQAAALLELLAAALLAFAAAGVRRAVRGRGAALATAGGVLGVLGTLGLAAIGFRHLFIYGLTASDQVTALRVLDRLDGGAGALVLPLLFAGPIALIVLAAAAARAGVTQSWVTFGAIGFFLSDMLPITAAEEIQGAVGIITFGFMAVRLLSGAPVETPSSVTSPSAQRRLEPSASTR